MSALERALSGRWAGVAAGLAGVAVVTWLIDLVGNGDDDLALTVCFPLLVLAVSGLAGLVPGLVTAIASAVAVNWFFVPPVHTLAVDDARDWVSLGVFAATALITSHLAAGFRRQRAESEARRRDAELLAELAGTVVAESPRGARGRRWGGRPRGPSALSGAGSTSARPGRRGPGRAPTALTHSAAGFAVPLTGGGRPLGLLEVGPARPGEEPRWATPGFAEAVAGLAAVAVERGRLLQTALEAESLRRSDELKTALLHGVSHEFRTPLTAIRTAADASPAGAPARPTAGLLAVLGEETERLDRLVANLLDLSRLEAGALVARMDWCAPAEIAAGRSTPAARCSPARRWP